MNQRKTLEIIWVNVKTFEAKKGKGVHGRSKTISTKSNSGRTNSTPSLSRTSSLNHTNNCVSNDDSKTPSTSWIKITKTNMK